VHNCGLCKNSWIDEDNDCGTCPTNWDATSDCSICLGNWDLASDCTTCKNSWVDEGNNCSTCPNYWDPAQDCGECLDGWHGSNCDDTCGNGFIGDQESCEDGNEIDWDGCTNCEISEFLVLGQEGGYSDVDMNSSGQSVIVYQVTGDDNYPDVYAVQLDPFGYPTSNPFQVNLSEGICHSRYPRVSINDDGSYIVAWVFDTTTWGAVYYRRFLSDNTPIDDTDKMVVSSTANKLNTVDALLNDNGAHKVAWHHNDWTTASINITQYDSDGSEINTYNATSGYMTGAGRGGVDFGPNDSFLATFVIGNTENGYFTDVLIRVFDLAAGEVLFETMVNDNLEHVQADPVGRYLSNGNIVVGWQDYDTNHVYAKIFDQDYDDLSGYIQVDNSENLKSYYIKIAPLANGSFAASWTDEDPTESNDVSHALFDASGVKLTEDLRTNVHLTSSQLSSFLVSNGDSLLLSIWLSWGQGTDCTEYCMFGQRIDSEGALLGHAELVP
jgi:hypothetical protein